MTLNDFIERNEGCVLYPYQDHLGYWTIGIGTCIDKEKGGITKEEAIWLFRNRLDKMIVDLERTKPVVKKLSETRRIVLFDMVYQLGVSGLMGFRGMWAALEAGHYTLAAIEMLDSLWAQQTPVRAKRNARIMQTGEME